ncbi:NAD(P)/FAD-dependent oxidoreductase [Acidimangrovimonas sediminis]|uniref:NAD(P)/FAD-dependent oxidoreductase n=1 Tax=Acidimangrovimonas sediminis TaxID=2056283 RepID=UPI000C7FF4AC|nr:FAD-binding oxidoreductase [Acidimangrovimonas sediminis]
MPGPRVAPLLGEETLPPRVDAVIIGAGIIGASTALELAERGLRVALCDKGGVSQEQSSRNWGWVRISRRDPREIPLMAVATRLWPGLNARTGHETGYRRSGILFACKDDEVYARYERWNEELRPYEIESRMVDRAEFDRLMPGNGVAARGALYTADDGRAEPQLAARAIVAKFQELGGVLLADCAVRGIETAAGAVCGVVTERGPIACGSVVLAGGMWSRLFAGNAGLELPQLGVINTALRTTPVAGGPEQALWTGEFSLRRRMDGGVTIASGTYNTVDIVPDSFRLAPAYLHALGAEWRSLRFRLEAEMLHQIARPRRWALSDTSPFEYHRTLDPKPVRRIAETAFAHARKRFPALEGARIAQVWAGCMDVTPDAVPVISAADAAPGFHIATGFSGHGFGIGPGAGRLMAQIVTGETPCVDPAPFRFSRFSDGSKNRMIAGF